jgi:uncharacterized protein
MRTITLEEHYATPRFLDGPGRDLKTAPAGVAEPLIAALCDLGEQRVAAMDAAGIDVQILSINAPGLEQLDAVGAEALARDVNDAAADAVRRRPERFAAFAALPTAAPERAAEELDRMVRERRFVGAVINGHCRGRYLDDRFFWPILDRAEALRVPIYLHPTPPPQPVIDASYGGFSSAVTRMLTGAGWGWHIETAVHVLRMILGGVFDRFPALQLVIGHLGEGLAAMLQRVDLMTPAATGLDEPVSAYLRRNVHYTISGFNFTSTFLDLLLQVGVDRIMFSADHPYGSMAEARTFLDRLPLSPADRARIAHENAERLLRL